MRGEGKGSKEKGLKKQIKSFQKGAQVTAYAAKEKGSNQGQQKGQKGRGHASGWQRWSGRPSRRSRYTQRQGWSACGFAVQSPPNATQRCMAEASEAPKAEAWDVSTGERSLPLAIPEPALVVDGRRGRRGLRAKGEAHQAGNLQATCDGDGTRAITTCDRGRVRRWRVAPGEHHRRPAGKLSG